MIRSYWTAGVVALAAFSSGCSVEVAEADASEDAESVGETREALTDVPGLTLGVSEIYSFWNYLPTGGFPVWIFGCGAHFTDNVHMLQTRCILQEFTPQTNTWRSISPWKIDRQMGSTSHSWLQAPCTTNRVSILRTINRTALRTSSGGWTDEEEKIGPAQSVRCEVY